MAASFVVFLIFGVLAMLFGLAELALAPVLIRAEYALMRPLRRLFRRPAPDEGQFRRRVRIDRAWGVAAILMGAYIVFHIPFRLQVAPDYMASRSFSGTLNNAKLQAEVAQEVRPVFEKGGAVGVVVAVVSGGESAVFGFGRPRLTSEKSPDGRTIFEIGSVTKTFTATALAAMANSGAVKLDDPVSTLLPASFKAPTYRGKQITLRHLATHTSGLPRVASGSTSIADYLTMRFLLNPYASFSPERLRRFLGTYTLTRAPGAINEYSNLGAGILGYALSVKHGGGYEEMVKTLVCRPLGMLDTTISLSADQRRRFAQGFAGRYSEDGSEMAILAPAWTFQDASAGAGALHSTADDLLKLIRASLDEADSPVKRSLRHAQTPQMRIDERMDMCLGWHTLKGKDLPGEIIWHNGGTGGFASFVSFCRKTGTGVVVLTNFADDDGITDHAAIRILRAISRRPSAAKPSARSG